MAAPHGTHAARVHAATVETGQVEVGQVQADEICVKVCKLVSGCEMV